MYGELAAWWPLLSPPEDYADEAAFFAQLLREEAQRPVNTVLELGAGGGHNAFHLKSHFDMTLSDLSPAMLAVSQALNPECAHHIGDMRHLRLGALFDAVFLHDAADYLLTQEDLHAAVQTAYSHLAPGGVFILAPDHTEESFMEHTVHGGSDDATRGIRYLEWTYDPVPDDQRYRADYVYLLHHTDGHTSTVLDQHECGLFPHATWLAALAENGFTAKSLSDAWGRDIFVGVRTS